MAHWNLGDERARLLANKDKALPASCGPAFGRDRHGTVAAQAVAEGNCWRVEYAS
jgi:hypothetical protein